MHRRRTENALICRNPGGEVLQLRGSLGFVVDITWPVHLTWDQSSSDGSAVRIIR